MIDGSFVLSEVFQFGSGSVCYQRLIWHCWNTALGRELVGTRADQQNMLCLQANTEPST